MPVSGIAQPEIIEVSPTLRLKKYAGEFDFALPWYQDPVVLRMSEGESAKPYTLDNLAVMLPCGRRICPLRLARHRCVAGASAGLC